MYFEDIRMEKEFIIESKMGNMVEHELHIHDVLEIHVLQENEALFRLANKQYEGKPGDVFLFRPFEPHWNLVKQENYPIRWISILFSPAIVRHIPNGYPLLYPFYAMESVSPYIPKTSVCAREIQSLAAKAVSEEEEVKLGWEYRQFAAFIEILALILQHAQKYYADRPQGKFDESVLQAIAYLLSHYTEAIEITEVMGLIGGKKSYFYSIFKKMTGVTPNQFVHRLRMQHAIHLLKYSKLSVTEISFECGYESIQYFIKQFNDFQAVSPGKFRKSFKNE